MWYTSNCKIPAVGVPKYKQNEVEHSNLTEGKKATAKKCIAVLFKCIAERSGEILLNKKEAIPKDV